MLRLIHGVPETGVQAIGMVRVSQNVFSLQMHPHQEDINWMHEAVVYEASHRNLEMHDPCTWSSGSRAGQI